MPLSLEFDNEAQEREGNDSEKVERLCKMHSGDVVCVVTCFYEIMVMGECVNGWDSFISSLGEHARICSLSLSLFLSHSLTDDNRSIPEDKRCKRQLMGAGVN